ncbi:MAG TPA: hypothetical protein VK327_12500 [Candidatus Paceibacterota bacterium]|nr:hypothetical protein [Candidatus Paceibacterota bacterium]
MKIAPLHLLMLVLAVPLLAVSCAHTKTYVEPSGPAEQCAVLMADAPLWLVTLDGESILGGGFSDHREIKVQPGAHELEVSLAGFENLEVKDGYGRPHLVRRNMASRGSMRLRFNAAAGETYVVGYKRSQMGIHDVSGKWRPFIHEFEPVK